MEIATVAGRGLGIKSEVLEAATLCNTESGTILHHIFTIRHIHIGNPLVVKLLSFGLVATVNTPSGDVVRSKSLTARDQQLQVALNITIQFNLQIVFAVRGVATAPIAVPEGRRVAVDEHASTEVTTVATTEVVLAKGATELACLGDDLLLRHIVGNDDFLLGIGEHQHEVSSEGIAGEDAERLFLVDGHQIPLAGTALVSSIAPRRHGATPAVAIIVPVGVDIAVGIGVLVAEAEVEEHRIVLRAHGPGKFVALGMLHEGVEGDGACAIGALLGLREGKTVGEVGQHIGVVGLTLERPEEVGTLGFECPPAVSASVVAVHGFQRMGDGSRVNFFALSGLRVLIELAGNHEAVVAALGVVGHLGLYQRAVGIDDGLRQGVQLLGGEGVATLTILSLGGCRQGCLQSLIGFG